LIAESTFDGQANAHHKAISRQQQMLILNRWAEIIGADLHSPARRMVEDCTLPVRYERELLEL